MNNDEIAVPISPGIKCISTEDFPSTSNDMDQWVIPQWKPTRTLCKDNNETAAASNLIQEQGIRSDTNTKEVVMCEMPASTNAALRGHVAVERVLHEDLSTRRRFSLQLPSFVSLGISNLNRTLSVQDCKSTPFCDPEDTFELVQTISCSTLPCSLHDSPAPLTPPPEGQSVIQFNHFTRQQSSRASPGSQSRPGEDDNHITQTHTVVNSRPQNILLPALRNMSSSSQFHQVPWLIQVSGDLVASLNDSAASGSMLMVSQTLPSQAKDSRIRPTFEEILEILQTELTISPYITVTHAVPQARVMEELPKTPPSTPNVRREISDYFDNDQTIFTHAAVVPIYHTHTSVDRNIANKLPHHIAAPRSVQVAVLERYIPPTMPQEVEDFFSLSTRSYLVDRLSELSANNGSLLLVYPTRTGGETFARQYIGPVIDPHLRRFIMLNGLTSAAASAMGSMTAVGHMLDFQEMQRRITILCQDLTVRSTGRGPQSAYNVTRAETANVVLERSTWIDWYIEQEQSRLRQNLVEYHQAGGRMPVAESPREITVGMLVRDFVEGIQKSKEPAGGIDIELGVFLITRSTV